MKNKILIRISVSLFLTLIVWLLLRFCLTGNMWFLLYFVPYLLIGYDVVFAALRNIVKGKMFDERFLMTIATVCAFVTGEYLEAVAVMLLYQLGEYLQSVAVGKSRKSIADLMDICPDMATIIKDGREQVVDASEVNVGDIVIVKAGEKIPVDGVILTGSTSLNMVALTGESLPRDFSASDAVLSGSINIQGVITVRATAAFCDSTASKILELVENSAAKKAKTENFITKFAKYYTPVVTACALLLAVIPSLFDGNWNQWIGRAAVFLVVSCPCALVISVPLTFFGGIGGASRKGVLIKGSSFLEALSRVKRVVFDKTGTLTKGNFAVTNVCPVGISADELLSLTAHAESRSTHPIARSVTAANSSPIDEKRIGEVEELSGRGIRAVIDGKTVCVGNAELMSNQSVDFVRSEAAGTVLYVSRGKQYLGFITVADQIKGDSAQAISRLGALGINETAILSGDGQKTTLSIAESLGITQARWGLLPDKKVDALDSLMKDGVKTAYVGDGINDAPVLARADVGIAMGALGSDAAIEAADVVLLNDSPMQVCTAITVARKTMRIVRQNVIFALAVKLAVMVLSSVGLGNMWLAVFADVGVTVLAVFNSIRALKVDTDKTLSSQKTLR